MQQRRFRAAGFSLAIAAMIVATAGSRPLFAEDPKPTKPAPANLGVRVPAGFEVTLYADDPLAHDIFSMTVDSLGRVVVAGPGYVRILIDKDGDGVADSFKQFADSPKTGAQGLYFHGRDLICTGDAGLLRYRDRNGDDRADGPPDVFLRMKTGGEHHTHAIRQGPDGWWYLIAGNMAGVNAKYATLPTSPVRQPESGTLLRLKPDLSGGEIFADGFRNTYDFAFNDLGDIFTYDSDGERDISLPWYRPTRVFHTLPGSHAGWISRSWKRPGTYFDMPPVVGAFGRGSPTGVACYRHTQFPAKYHNAVFALDWTFGRVLLLPLLRDGSTWTSKPLTFMTGKGEFGFAPTDVAVGPDGSLYVSVGGRGTRGGVFRVRYVGKEKPKPIALPEGIAADLWDCLNAPQPLSSWSRAKWMPVAKKLGDGPFRSAALNKSLPDSARIRAIEILTEMFDGLRAKELALLATAKSAEVRARAAWSHGRIHEATPDIAPLGPYLTDGSSAVVRRTALEALLGFGPKTDVEKLLPYLAKRLGDDDRYVRQTASRLVAKLTDRDIARIRNYAKTAGVKTELALELGNVQRKHAVNLQAFATGVGVLERKASTADSLDALRLLQLALGDFGPRGKRDPVYDSYDSRVDLKKHERALDPYRVRLSKLFPSGDVSVDYELARVIAMLAPYNRDLLTAMLAKITKASHPVDDIHYLIVTSRIPAERNSDQTLKIANAFLQLDEKIRARKLRQDSNWDSRVGEMYKKHAEIDPDLPLTIVSQPGFGRPGHILFLQALQDTFWQTAIDAIAKQIRKTGDYPWTTDVVFLLGESKRTEHLDLIRKQYSNFGLRDAVLLVLSQKPLVIDRDKFIAGLDSGQLNVLQVCAEALGKFPADGKAAEQLALYKAARRLGRDKREIPIRDALMKRLQQTTGKTFDYRSGGTVDNPQPAAMKQWETWLTKTYPEDARKLLAAGGEDLAMFQAELAKVVWKTGDIERGRVLFHKRSCVQCHGGRQALGPDLAGVAKRFSRDDFFTAVVQPNRDVSPRYQTTQVVTTGGKAYVGLIVYVSVDGITLRTGQNQTIRVESADIEERRQLNTSLMPTGLLKGLKPQDLADLYAYVRSLSR